MHIAQKRIGRDKLVPDDVKMRASMMRSINHGERRDLVDDAEGCDGTASTKATIHESMRPIEN